MAEDVHIIPVGFDFERLIQPISRNGLNADRIILLHSVEGTEDEYAAALVDDMLSNLERSFGTVLGLPVRREKVECDIFDYGEIYELAYRVLTEELDAGNNVYVNISSMPRTVAFGFATAASALVIENPDLRPSVTTYYASPEKYLVTELIRELENTRDFLEEKLPENDWAEARFNKIDELLRRTKQGITSGTQKIDGKYHVPFPPPPLANLELIEQQILWYLQEAEDLDSISMLARGLAEEQGKEYDDSYNNKTQYNIKKLENKGYVNRIEDGKSLRPQLSTMGELWARTHQSE